MAYDLLQRLAAPGCPICALVEHSVTRLLEGISYEALTDPDTRLRLRDSLAYCAPHGRQWQAVQNTLGTAIIYRDMCNQAAEEIARRTGDLPSPAAAGGLRERWQSLRAAVGNSEVGRSLAAALAPRAPCPACRQTLEIEAQAATSCAAAFAGAEFLQAYAAHPMGLCLPHFRAVLPQIRELPTLRVVAEAQAAHLVATSAQLSEVIHKYDYRFQREPHGAEFEAPARSVEQIGGRLPTQLNLPPS